MKDRLVVIARYKEDLDWLKDLNNPFMVYNKGPEWPYEITRKDIPNKGREPETYLRAIIENYSSLDQYKYMVFLQGNPFDHCDELYEKINSFDDENNISFLCKDFGCFEIENLFYLDQYPIQLIECLLCGNILTQSGANKCLFLLGFLGIELQKCKSFYACGAQYIVPTKFILNKPVEWWMHVYRVYDCYINFNIGDPALLFEFIWPLIWAHKSKIKE